jgi:hypothetical protein
VKAWRIGLATLAIGLAIGGCTPQPPPPPPAPPPPVTTYDGTYQGTVKLTNVGAGVPRKGCATTNKIVLQVKNSAFTYAQPHPNMTGNGTTTYTVTIAPNGSLSGQSQLSGQITGTVSGTHMAGTIDGIECVYSFTADRG